MNNIIGRKCGLLTVHEIVSEKEVTVKSKNRTQHRIVRFHRCICDCGKECIINRNNLLSKHTKSCGCLSLRKGSANPTWTGFGRIGGKFWSTIVSKAKQRELAFEISIEEAWAKFEEQAGKCALTGTLIEFGNENEGKTASLDRIDNSKGYLVGNIQWVHKDINWMKGTFASDRFLELCRKVTYYADRIGSGR